MVHLRSIFLACATQLTATEEHTGQHEVSYGTHRLQNQPVDDTAVFVVPLLGCLVNQPVGCRRKQFPLHEEHVADLDRADFVGIPDDVLVVAAVSKLPKVNVGVARVLGPNTAGVAHNGT